MCFGFGPDAVTFGSWCALWFGLRLFVAFLVGGGLAWSGFAMWRVVDRVFFGLVSSSTPVPGFFCFRVVLRALVCSLLRLGGNLLIRLFCVVFFYRLRWWAVSFRVGPSVLCVGVSLLRYGGLVLYSHGAEFCPAGDWWFLFFLIYTGTCVLRTRLFVSVFRLCLCLFSLGGVCGFWSLVDGLAFSLFGFSSCGVGFLSSAVSGARICGAGYV